MQPNQPVARLFRLGDGQHWPSSMATMDALAPTRREALDLIRAELMIDIEV